MTTRYDDDGEPMTWCEGMGRWEREDDLRAEFAGESTPDDAEEDED
jgi:hypothetical protein